MGINTKPYPYGLQYGIANYHYVIAVTKVASTYIEAPGQCQLPTSNYNSPLYLCAT